MVNLSSRKPRFNAGDRVEVAVHGEKSRKTGTVAEIVSAPIDAVYRYRVQFDDGSSGVYFGFELEILAGPRASNY
jgi:hypothetical protein